jgi:hypothetical protein
MRVLSPCGVEVDHSCWASCILCTVERKFGEMAYEDESLSVLGKRAVSERLYTVFEQW